MITENHPFLRAKNPTQQAHEKSVAKQMQAIKDALKINDLRVVLSSDEGMRLIKGWIMDAQVLENSCSFGAKDYMMEGKRIVPKEVLRLVRKMGNASLLMQILDDTTHPYDTTDSAALNTPQTQDAKSDNISK